MPTSRVIITPVAWAFPKAPHSASRRMAQAFAAGANAAGEHWVSADYPSGLSERNAVYGILHGGGDIIRHCEERGLDYWYIDHGYFCRSKGLYSMEGYFRIVKNDLQHRDVSGPTTGRFQNLGINLLPTETLYRPNLVALPPSEHQISFYGSEVAKDFYRHIEWIGHQYDEVIFSRKGDKIPLTKHLEDASYCIGFNSTGLFEAARRGIPVEATGPSPLSRLRDCLETKEWEEERLRIFQGCAERQFTLAEIADGTAFRNLRALGEI